MYDWLGLGLITLGVILGIAGIFKRRSRRRTTIAAGAIRPEFAAMGEIARPMVLFAVGFIAFKMSLFYFVFGGSRLLTPLQYGGLMFVMACYCLYLIAATAKPSVAPAPSGVAEPAGMWPAT